ncbi:hypothetical protein CYMTET_29476 [Cymbomonas tetramitiformis]|uniref:Uncharacterized protein n=1 Tax=Cymbomonas tetramitiformis TaxID=36881 RepID=A0AAE0FME3_9CHLO|nr:hypothetical protein CYMTET_29476 [Cymbomonas tetramitiformis]
MESVAAAILVEGAEEVEGTGQVEGRGGGGHRAGGGTAWGRWRRVSKGSRWGRGEGVVEKGGGGGERKTTDSGEGGGDAVVATCIDGIEGDGLAGMGVVDSVVAGALRAPRWVMEVAGMDSGARPGLGGGGGHGFGGGRHGGDGPGGGLVVAQKKQRHPAVSFHGLLSKYE